MFEQLKDTVNDAIDTVSSGMEKITTVDVTENFDNTFWPLEQALLHSNVAIDAIDAIKDAMQDDLEGERIGRGSVEERVTDALRHALLHVLDEGAPVGELITDAPYVIVFTGVNGSGKTTTLAKIAHAVQQVGKSVVAAAADTYRAASIEQLEEHTKNLDCALIKHEYESDPAAVGYDAVEYAEANDIDVVLIDTAGRLHSNTNLMDELAKLVRVNTPDHTFFIGESTTGNDCVSQAREFDDAVAFDGIILTKADVDENGGAAISVSHATGKPIHYLGTGQEYTDLERFDKEAVVDDLLP